MSAAKVYDPRRRLEERVARELAQAPLVPYELAQRMDIKTGHACETLDALVRKGWVKHHENEQYAVTDRYREHVKAQGLDTPTPTGGASGPPTAKAKTIAAFFAEEPQHLARVADHEIYQRTGRGQALWALTPDLALVELPFSELPHEEAMREAQRCGYVTAPEAPPLPAWRLTLGQKIQEFAVVEVHAPDEAQACRRAIAGDVENWIEDWHGDTTVEGSTEIIDSDPIDTRPEAP